jgi:hypothetical protein
MKNFKKLIQNIIIYFFYSFAFLNTNNMLAHISKDISLESIFQLLSVVFLEGH